MDYESKEIYEIIACYFVNKYWGNLYTNSLKSRDYDEPYKVELLAFANEFRNDMPNRGKHDTPYAMAIEKICTYYNEQYNRNKDIRQFISTIYKVIVGDYEASEYPVDFDKMDQITKTILTDVVNVYTMYIIKDELHAPRNNKDMVALKRWKDKFIIIFKNKIKQYRTLVVSHRNGVDIEKQEDQEMVPVEIVEKLKRKLAELHNEIIIITKERNQYAMLAKNYYNSWLSLKKMEHMNVQNPNTNTPFVKVSEQSADNSSDILDELSSGEEFSMDY